MALREAAGGPGVRGLVLRGSRNVFTVLREGERPDGPTLECRLKGKVLKGTGRCYNPLAPGDVVLFEPETALISALEPRRNALLRFNRKGQAPQCLAANVDQVLCVTSPASPPFRPRFLDRALVEAADAGLEALIVCNKADLILDAQTRSAVEGRLKDFERIGYRVLRVSALSGEGMEGLRALVSAKRSALLGQSGVGKSSLINALLPGLGLKTGELNTKWDRGSHTTVEGRLFQGRGAAFIDTPGIRQLVPCSDSGQLALLMPEFAPLAGTCRFGLSCTHRSESGCAVLQAVAAGRIHPERYESFLRMSGGEAGGGSCRRAGRNGVDFSP